MDQARQQFVEEFAQVIEYGGGTTRTAARIQAFLLTDDVPYRSLQELTQELGVSKASISTNTRVLIAQRMIRRVPVAGSRMEHYGLEPGGVSAALLVAAEVSRRVSALAVKGEELLGDAVTPSRAALRDMHEVYGELADAIDNLIAKRVRRAQ